MGEQHGPRGFSVQRAADLAEATAGLVSTGGLATGSFLAAGAAGLGVLVAESACIIGQDSRHATRRATCPDIRRHARCHRCRGVAGRVIGLAVLGFWSFIFAVAGGVGGCLIGLGLITMLLGTGALIRGRVRWAWLMSRRAGVVALVSGVVLVVIGSVLSPTDGPPQGLAPSTVRAAVVTPSPTPMAVSPIPTPVSVTPTTSTRPSHRAQCRRRERLSSRPRPSS